jgi:hypothetical protein
VVAGDASAPAATSIVEHATSSAVADSACTSEPSSSSTPNAEIINELSSVLSRQQMEASPSTSPSTSLTEGAPLVAPRDAASANTIGQRAVGEGVRGMDSSAAEREGEPTKRVSDQTQQHPKAGEEEGEDMALPEQIRERPGTHARGITGWLDDMPV